MKSKCLEKLVKTRQKIVKTSFNALKYRLKRAFDLSRRIPGRCICPTAPEKEQI